jgi:myo-inositol-1(or 4)-monophosphatase
MDEYLAFAQDLARQGGKLIKDNFGNNLEVELKADHTPVTQVDKQINQMVIEAIQKTYPEHGVLGEEASIGTGREELQWLCDPLDGTKAFIMGIPLSTFILGLSKAGQILLAVVYDPFQDNLYHAVKGKGAFCNSRPIHVNQDSLQSGGYLIVSESSFQFAKPIAATGAQIEPLPGAGYRAMVLAAGRCSASLQGKADNHDVGPASLIVEEAGGKVTDLSGMALRYDQPLTNGIILSNDVCHDELVAIVNYTE